MKSKNLKSLTNEQRVKFVADFVFSFGSEVVIDKIIFLRSSGLSIALFPLHGIDKPDSIHIVVNCYDTPYI